jgi:hypothetical protein
MKTVTTALLGEAIYFSCFSHNEGKNIYFVIVMRRVPPFRAGLLIVAPPPPPWGQITNITWYIFFQFYGPFFDSLPVVPCQKGLLFPAKRAFWQEKHTPGAVLARRLAAFCLFTGTFLLSREVLTEKLH